MNAQTTAGIFTRSVRLYMAGVLAAGAFVLAAHWISGPSPSSNEDALTDPDIPTQPAANESPNTAGSVVSLQPPTLPAPSQPSALEEKWGIRISSVGLIMDGRAILLSYKVLVPDQADLMRDDNIPAFLEEPRSGAKILLRVPSPMGTVPAHSRARSAALAGQQGWAFPPPRNKLMADKTYSLVLPNTASVITTGSKVDVVIGDLRAGGFTVQ